MLVSMSHAQQLVVADVSATSFPLVTMRVYSFDRDGNPAPLDPQRDRLVTERMGVVRQTTAVVTCASEWKAEPIAAIIAFDWASDVVRQHARTIFGVWNTSAPSGSTIGAVIFGARPYLVRDFTSDATSVADVLDGATPLEVAVPHRALADTLLGAITLATVAVCISRHRTHVSTTAAARICRTCAPNGGSAHCACAWASSTSVVESTLCRKRRDCDR